MTNKEIALYDLLQKFASRILKDIIKSDFDFELLGLICVYCSKIDKADNYATVLYFTEQLFSEINNIFYKSNLHLIDTWRRELILDLVEEVGKSKDCDLSDEVTFKFRKF